MNKITHARQLDACVIELRFSDGTVGEYDLAPVVKRDTVLTCPLSDPEYFRSFFLALGALAWPNGLEFSGAALHKTLREGGRLHVVSEFAQDK